MVLETYMMCVTAGLCGKEDFAPKIGKITQKWAKTGFFELIEKFAP